jgi:hypothetical protein
LRTREKAVVSDLIQVSALSRLSKNAMYMANYSRKLRMAKVITGSLKRKRRKTSGVGSVRVKRILGPDGKPRKVWTLDAHSFSFGEDLQYVFGKNVSKARRANKRILGSTDLAPRKA